MRILSLGFPLPGPAVDNFTFLNAPSFFDYDALVVDPRALSQLIEDVVTGRAEHTSYSGERIMNAPSGADGVSLAELLHNRADETSRLLARGGLVVCLAVPNGEHEGVQDFASVNRYYWLPAPHGLAYDTPFLRRGAGTELAPIEVDHPFAAMLAQVKTQLAYQVHFDERSPGFDGRVIARSAGGAAIAIELSVAGGRVVLLPPPARPLDSQGRYQVSDVLQEAIRQVLRLSSASSAPRWLSEYGLPGLDERMREQGKAEHHLTEAQESLEASNAALDELERYRKLLWEEGRLGLEEAVRQALTLLGFRVTPESLDAPAQIDIDGPALTRRVALLETDGSEEAVGLDVHYRLRHRLEEAIAQGSPQRGLLVINGYRRTPPAERAGQYTNELRMAAEQMRYCLATTEQLFHAVRASLSGDDATVERFREQLLTAEGVLQED
jgi:hypothetical protein